MSSTNVKRTQADFIPLSEPLLAGNEWEYVRECLDTGWVSTAGSFVGRFEHDLAKRVSVAHAVAMVNGTSALHIALLAAGVKPDDLVIVNDLTFIAPANAIRYAGAWPLFIDADPDTWQIDTEQLARLLEEECELRGETLLHVPTGRRIAALLPVHILGGVCDADRLTELASAFKLPLIEDATECLGATYKGQPAGTHGLIGCYSFNGNKIITTGGGGMLATHDSEINSLARYLSTQAKDDAVEYRHEQLGYNYRMPNVLAAIGTAQLEQLDKQIEARRAVEARYHEAFADVEGITLRKETEGSVSNGWLTTVLFDEERFGKSSREVMAALEGEQIQTRPLWTPLHQTVHRKWTHGSFPIAERLQRQALSLPSSSTLTPEQQERIIELILSYGN